MRSSACPQLRQQTVQTPAAAADGSFRGSKHPRGMWQRVLPDYNCMRGAGAALCPLLCQRVAVGVSSDHIHLRITVYCSANTELELQVCECSLFYFFCWQRILEDTRKQC